MSEQNPLVDYSVGQKYLDPNEIRMAPWSPTEEDTKTAGYDRWARMAPEIMSEPVISSKYMADQLGMDPEVAQRVFGDRISMGDFLTAYTRLTEASALADRMRENGVQEEMIQGMVQAQAEHFGPQWEAKAEAARNSLVTGRGTASQIALAKSALDAVAAHTPKGPYAQYAGRTQEEAKQATAQYGMSADFALTPAGQQNYAAQRVIEFFDAASPDYEPATGWGQLTRIAGGLFSPFQRGVQELTMGGAKDVVDEQGNNVYMEPFADAERLSLPGGKYDFAADLAQRSKGATNVYDQQGRANFLMNSALTPSGMGNAYLNASYPIGYGVNALFGNKQWGDFVGIAMEDGLAAATEDADAARAIRTQGNRITPITIPGMTPEQMQSSARGIEANDAASDAYASATLGPALTLPGQKPGYLSPFGSGMFNILGELVSDPINVAYTAAGPAGVAAGQTVKNIAYTGGKTLFPPFKNAVIPHLKQGLQNYTMGTMGQVKNIGGQVLDEGIAEPIQFGLPTSGMDLFKPQKTNALIDTFGNGKKPGDEGYDANEANVRRVMHRRETLKPVIEAQRRTRVKAEPMDYQRPPSGGRMMY